MGDGHATHRLSDICQRSTDLDARSYRREISRARVFFTLPRSLPASRSILSRHENFRVSRPSLPPAPLSSSAPSFYLSPSPRLAVRSNIFNLPPRANGITRISYLLSDYARHFHKARLFKRFSFLAAPNRAIKPLQFEPFPGSFPSHEVEIRDDYDREERRGKRQEGPRVYARGGGGAAAKQ